MSDWCITHYCSTAAVYTQYTIYLGVAAWLGREWECSFRLVLHYQLLYNIPLFSLISHFTAFSDALYTYLQNSHSFSFALQYTATIIYQGSFTKSRVYMFLIMTVLVKIRSKYMDYDKVTHPCITLHNVKISCMYLYNVGLEI